jgi:general secretion pathway protein E
MAGMRSLGEIADYAELPEFVSIASHGDSPRVQLTANVAAKLLVLETRDAHFVVLACKSVHAGTAWFDAVQQGRRLGWAFEGAYTCADDVIRTFLQEHVHERESILSRKRDKQDHEVFSRLVTDSVPLEWLRLTVARVMDLRASDMHLEVRGEAGMLRVRRDGLMRKVANFPSRVVVQGVAAAYTMLAQEGTRTEVAFNASMAQSALIALDLAQGKVLLRYQSHPTAGGFDVVLRILRVGQQAQESLPRLEALGYTDWQCEQLIQASASAWGGVFIAGVTGSGKTTTLCSLLQHLTLGHRRKIVAIEDPVEYNIPGVSHLSIQRQAGVQSVNPFESAMMAFLRMDPDVGMFGEIRDSFSGAMAQTAIQTGHKLLTTVHATSALSIVSRLASEQIGLRREDICNADFLSLLVYQALVPKNCVHCSVPAAQALPVSSLQAYEHIFQLDPASMRCASQHGCSHCSQDGLQSNDEGHAGVHGMTVVAEVVPVDPNLLALLRAGDDLQARTYAMAQRKAGFDEPDMQGKEAWGHALYLVATGQLDPFHFERCFGAPALLARARALG